MSTTPKADSAPIVVGVDGSSCSGVALQWAAEEAARRNVPLRIVHITPITDAGFVDEPPVEGEGRRIANEAATAVGLGLDERAPHIETFVVDGYPIERLLQLSADGCILVLGSRGHGAFASFLVGSVAAGCLHAAIVPVVIIKDESALLRDGDVVVGVDDSKGGKAALQWAADEAGVRGSRLVVVNAREASHVVRPDHDRSAVEEHMKAGRRFLDDEISSLDAIERPPFAVGRVHPLPAPEALIEAAEGAALLVVGSRGRGSLSRLVLGSVSQHCVHYASCPVVVVPTTVPPSTFAYLGPTEPSIDEPR